MWAAGQTGRAVCKEMNRTKSKDNIRCLQRKDQVIIFRLRTQHVPLNYHLNRINPQHPPMCLLCDHVYETAEHLLLKCDKLQDLRQQFLPPSPIIDNTLYCDKQQLERTSKFYHMAQAEGHKSKGFWIRMRKKMVNRILLSIISIATL